MRTHTGDTIADRHKNLCYTLLSIVENTNFNKIANIHSAPTVGKTNSGTRGISKTIAMSGDERHGDRERDMKLVVTLSPPSKC